MQYSTPVIRAERQADSPGAQCMNNYIIRGVYKLADEAENRCAHGPTAVLPVPRLIATGESGIWPRSIISLDAERFCGVVLGLWSLPEESLTRTCKGCYSQTGH